MLFHINSWHIIASIDYSVIQCWRGIITSPTKYPPTGTVTGIGRAPGPRSTGRYQGGATLFLDNPLSLSDLFNGFPFRFIFTTLLKFYSDGPFT
ncbi:hypothetical protein CBW57_18935 [Yersinia intermedia]|uniref:Haemolysin activator HlyB C-terminal domain-containing protein n=1 Tax=Yersinia intermedia TaxID=631 RepID=A0A208ZS84_YERIN|nr:hypothetical protein CBW57_18935 [Yersinia intermedia]